MHQVSISASSYHIRKPALSYDRQIPASWPEVGAERAWRCLDHIMMLEYWQMPVLQHLLDVPVRIWNKLESGQLYDLIRLLEWMQIDTQATAPVADKILIGQQWYHLPADKFANVTGLEFALITDLYKAYVDSGDTTYQDKLIAVVLRPAGYSEDPAGDPRVKLVSGAQSRTWLDDITSLSPGIKGYITLLISANIQAIHDVYGAWIFDTQEDDKKEGEEGFEQTMAAEDTGINLRWWGTFLSIAENGVFGTYEQVLHTDIHTICTHLLRKAEEHKRQKREHEAHMARLKARS